MNTLNGKSHGPMRKLGAVFLSVEIPIEMF